MVQHENNTEIILETLKRVLEKDLELQSTSAICKPCSDEGEQETHYEPHRCEDCEKAMCSHYAYLFNFATSREYAMCLDCVMSSERYAVKRLAESFRKLGDEIMRLQK